MNLKRLVPMAEVQNVARSIAFYANLMVTSGAAPASTHRSVLFYLYCPDVAEARKALEAAGVECGPVQFPFYAPRGEFEVRDPDGYSLMVTHT